MDNGRYATAVVHATKDEIPIIFHRVHSQTPECHKPTIVKSDNAPEYHTQQLREVLKKHNVEEQMHYNEHQQFQNGRAEKLVDSIGRKIRAMLLQSQMPPEFWGAAVVLATDIYNCAPHRSLGMESLIITGITNSPTFHFSVLSDVLLSYIEDGTSSSTPSLHHRESWVCIWVLAPVTVVAPSL